MILRLQGTPPPQDSATRTESRSAVKGFANLIELASVTGHREVNVLKRYYNITAEELAAKLVS